MPTVAVAGQVAVGRSALRAAGNRAAYSLVDVAGDVDAAIAKAPELLHRIGCSIAARLGRGRATSSAVLR